MHTHDFQRLGPIWGVGVNGRLEPFQKFITLVPWPIPTTGTTTRAFFKVCLVLIFLNAIEKNIPWALKLLFYISLCSKSLFQSSQNLEYKFSDENDLPPPPPLELIQRVRQNQCLVGNKMGFNVYSIHSTLFVQINMWSTQASNQWSHFRH